MLKLFSVLAVSVGFAVSASPAFALKLEKRTVREQGIDLPIYIYWPDKVQGKIPAMLLVHGSSGLNLKAKSIYPENFGKAGVATIFIDTFSPRGVRDTVRNQASVDPVNLAKDALATLNYVDKNFSEIDSTRIGVMGFSKGGIVAYFLALKALNPNPDALHFARFIAMYPACNGIRLHPETIGPLTIIVGSDDTLDNPHFCEEMVKQFQDLGNKDVVLRVIPGAKHSWDVKGPSYNETKGENAYNCRFIELKTCYWIEAKTKLVIYNHGRTPDRPKALKSCLTPTVSWGYSAKATEISMKYIMEDVEKLRK
jgi:dienelactone hydrolase